MISRLRTLFQRYRAANEVVKGRKQHLYDTNGAKVGRVETVTLRQSMLYVSGWVDAPQVTLELCGTVATVAPSRQRLDDQTKEIVSNGFDVAIACPPYLLVEGYQPQLSAGGEIVPADLKIRTRPSIGLMLGFAWSVVRAMPSMLHWLMHHDAQSKARIKELLGLGFVYKSVEADVGLLPENLVAHASIDVPVTVIIPVYNAFELLPELLARTTANTDVPWHMIIVEDCSTNAQVRPFLRDWLKGLPEQDAQRVELIENEENLGFVGSVNKALAIALARDEHVVLLNSDALVPQGWTSRILAALEANGSVASATPMSNDAEIFSIPEICKRLDLRDGQLDAVDATAKQFASGVLNVEVPTGVGFCMALHKDWLKKVPQLDPIFGKGYGEEVDWCQKTRKLGGCHVAVPNLFVEHRGGQSFGSAVKQELISKSALIIQKRYPRYAVEVQHFIAADRLQTARLLLGLAWAGSLSDERVPVYVAHSLGGGAEHYLWEKIHAHTAMHGAAIILRVGGKSRWQLELCTHKDSYAITTDDWGFVKRALAQVGAINLVYSCASGDHDPLALPSLLLELVNERRDVVDMLVHDYFAFTPALNLLGEDGWYHGVGALMDDESVNVPQWSEAWRGMFAAARAVHVFSEHSRAMVLAMRPELEDKLHVTPHAVADVPVIARPETDVRVVAVLGNMMREKGAGVLVELAESLGKDAPYRLVVIGHIDPSYAVPSNLLVHGGYKVAELPQLVKRYAITDWLIPSICPETFSYTTHEALATGLPVHVFDLGAQADAARAATNGHVVAYEPVNNIVERLGAHLRAERLSNNSKSVLF